MNAFASSAIALHVIWADSRAPLTAFERGAYLRDAAVEAITPDELLLRTFDGRILAVVAEDGDPFCALCAHEQVYAKYGGTCPRQKLCTEVGHRHFFAKI